ncbi:hypothetical protein GCM10027348_42520 [Hymenobacter tenuis]
MCAAGQLGINEKLLYRWQQQQAAAEVGSDELARDPEVRALHAELQRAQREQHIQKKPFEIQLQTTPQMCPT